jgi:hypothetical protein
MADNTIALIATKHLIGYSSLGKDWAASVFLGVWNTKLLTI